MLSHLIMTRFCREFRFSGRETLFWVVWELNIWLLEGNWRKKRWFSDFFSGERVEIGKNQCSSSADGKLKLARDLLMNDFFERISDLLLISQSYWGERVFRVKKFVHIFWFLLVLPYHQAFNISLFNKISPTGPMQADTGTFAFFMRWKRIGVWRKEAIFKASSGYLICPIR